MCVFVSIPDYNRDKYYRIMNITQSNYANQWKRLSKDSKRADFILIYYSIAIIVYSLSVKFYPNLINEIWSTYAGLILSVIVLIFSIINSKAGYPERIAKVQVALNEVKRLKREVATLPELLPRECKTYMNKGGISSTVAVIANEEKACSSSCETAYNSNPHTQCQSANVCPELERIKKEYDDIVNNTEMRDDLDFYYTIRQLCKQNNLDPFTGKSAKGVDPKEVDEESPVIREIKSYISENNPRKQRFHVYFLTLYHFALYSAPVFIFLIGIIVNICLHHVP